MRLFFGLEPTPACKSAIADWRDRFGACDGRPVPAGNFHVTLSFLGDVGERRLESLCAAVDEQGTGETPAVLVLALDQVGFWPLARIYWLGPSADDDALDTLASMLQQVGQRIGARRDRRRFTPHVTLFRACGAPPPTPVALPSIEARFDSFVLFESRRERRGVRYVPIAEWSLAG